MISEQRRIRQESGANLESEMNVLNTEENAEYCDTSLKRIKK